MKRHHHARHHAKIGKREGLQAELHAMFFHEGRRHFHHDPEEGHPHGRGHHHKGEGGWQGGGPGGRARRGEARYVLLDALRDGPKHGYEIIKALEERSSGQYAPSPGTVYPTLQYLEDVGLVHADHEADRRVYSLTEKGQAELAVRAEEIDRFWGRLKTPDVSGVTQAEVNFLREDVQALVQTIRGGAGGAMDRDDTDTLRAIRQIVEQCRNEVRKVIASSQSEPPSARS